MAKARVSPRRGAPRGRAPRGRARCCPCRKPARPRRGRPVCSGNALARAGGHARAGKTRLADRLGLVELPPAVRSRPTAPPPVSFRRAQCAALAQGVGGGVCGAAPSSLVATAALQLAWSRFFSDKAAVTGDADLALTASRLGDASRQSLLAAHELCAKEDKRAGNEPKPPRRGSRRPPMRPRGERDRAPPRLRSVPRARPPCATDARAARPLPRRVRRRRAGGARGDGAGGRPPALRRHRDHPSRGAARDRASVRRTRREELPLLRAPAPPPGADRGPGNARAGRAGIRADRHPTSALPGKRFAMPSGRQGGIRTLPDALRASPRTDSI